MFDQNKGSSAKKIVPCARQACGRPAISYSDFCWKHLAGNRPKYRQFLRALALSKGLTQAYIVEVQMPGIDLSKSVIIDSSISNSNLVRSEFQQSQISNCSFYGSKLRHSDFNHSKLLHNDFSMCSLRGADFWGCDLTGSSFAGATLSETIFKKADLELTNFENINLFSLRKCLWEAAKNRRKAFFSYGIYWRHGQLYGEQSVFESLTTFKKRIVLILGQDTGGSEGLKTLRQIQEIVNSCDYLGLLVKDQPEIEEISNEEKVRLFADCSRFVILENSFSAGQIAELKMLATNRILTIILRRKGMGSSWMVSDYDVDFNFMKEFQYKDQNDLQEILKKAIPWAEIHLARKKSVLNIRYPWR